MMKNMMTSEFHFTSQFELGVTDWNIVLRMIWSLCCHECKSREQWPMGHVFTIPNMKAPFVPCALVTSVDRA